jgi:ribonuclease Z
VRKALAERKPVTLENGRVINPEDVLGLPVKGKRLVIVGDTETMRDWPNTSEQPTYL